jgi:hypothetical protein
MKQERNLVIRNFSIYVPNLLHLEFELRKEMIV